MNFIYKYTVTVSYVEPLYGDRIYILLKPFDVAISVSGSSTIASIVEHPSVSMSGDNINDAIEKLVWHIGQPW